MKADVRARQVSAAGEPGGRDPAGGELTLGFSVKYISGRADGLVTAVLPTISSSVTKAVARFLKWAQTSRGSRSEIVFPSNQESLALNASNASAEGTTSGEQTFLLAIPEAG